MLDEGGRPLPLRVVTYRDGVSVEAHDVGSRSAPAIVWVPGADGPKETFRFQIPEFARDYRCMTADLRGEFPARPTFDLLAEDVGDLADACGLDRFVLVGQSLGSAIAIRFASLHPDRLLGLVLLNPLARWTSAHMLRTRGWLMPPARLTTVYSPTPVARALWRLWSRLAVWNFDRGPQARNVLDYALTTGGRAAPPREGSTRVKAFKGVDLRPELAGIGVPALVLKGSRDAYCPVAWAEEIADLLPRSTYRTIPGTGHCGHLSHPQAVNEELAAWLSALSLTSGAPREDGMTHRKKGPE